ncbi:MAG: hypothetical protein GY748_17735 [Planctomycetaceae bacterium]|nr:hypothetical protein [Planctomycetaceae bacterium]
MPKKMKLVAILILITLFGCSAEETIAIHLDGAEINEQAPLAFKQKGIWFRHLEDGRFEFKKSDFNKVQAVMFEIREAIIPFGKSMSYGAEMEEIVLKKLKTSSIPVDVRRYDGKNWVVWQVENEAAIRKIEEEASAELQLIPIRSGKP